VLQAPQFSWFVLRSTSHPSESFPLQLPQPETQADTTQTPAQDQFAFFPAHFVPHAPQLLSVFNGDSQPSLLVALQSP
jgi:hypothetical protein